MPRKRFFQCAICKHSFTLHIPFCERKGCLCRGYVSRKEKILLHEHKFTLDALLDSKQQEVYKANSEIRQMPISPNVMSALNPYVIMLNKTTDFGANLWYCQICKKKDTWLKMLKHYHFEKTVKIKKKEKS